MDFIGFDLGKVSSQLCIITADGELLEHRVNTDREHLTKWLGSRPPARILIEAGTESEWVARHLETFGHEVVVADPNFAPMYATSSSRVKIDKRDARTLAEACRLGAYRPAHRTSDAQRHIRAKLAVREAIVRTRSKYISLCRALVRRDGLRVTAGTARSFASRLDGLPMSVELQVEIAPLRRAVGKCQRANQAGRRRTRATRQRRSGGQAVDDGAGRRSSDCRPAPSPRSTTWHASLTLNRRALTSGWCLRSIAPASAQLRGRIAKAGPNRARYLLVEAAWALMRSSGPEGAALRRWAAGIRERRGTKVAIVALARKLAGILYAMWRDAKDFAPPLQHREVVAACTGA